MIHFYHETANRKVEKRYLSLDFSVDVSASKFCNGKKCLVCCATALIWTSSNLYNMECASLLFPVIIMIEVSVLVFQIQLISEIANCMQRAKTETWWFGEKRQRDRRRERVNGLVNYSHLTFWPSVMLVDRCRQAWICVLNCECLHKGHTCTCNVMKTRMLLGLNVVYEESLWGGSWMSPHCGLHCDLCEVCLLSCTSCEVWYCVNITVHVHLFVLSAFFLRFFAYLDVHAS